jgi:aminoglycoside 3-N-acetyltransferase
VFNFFRQRWGGGPVQVSHIEAGLAMLGFTGAENIIMHTSLSAFGYVQGGAPALLEAVRAHVNTLVVPTFTYYTLVWPSEYRTDDWKVELPIDGPMFRLDSPVSPDIGRVPQALLTRRNVLRSQHPALSFAAVGQHAHSILAAQTLDHPYAPIGQLYALDGDVLLMGVDHRSNTSIHYGEYLAGRPLLDRYANSSDGVVHTYFPNCSAGFDQLEPRLTIQTTQIGKATIKRMKVREIVDETLRALRRNPEALLCNHQYCRCQAVRQKVKAQVHSGGLVERNDRFLEFTRHLAVIDANQLPHNNASPVV